MDRNVKLHDLQHILGSSGVDCDESGGKGSYVKFYRSTAEGTIAYMAPREREVRRWHVAGARRRFKLPQADGVSDEEFYSR